MKLIVTTVPFSSQPDFEDPSQGDKFAAAKNEAETGSFAVTDVDAGDDGVYFCAVSKHTAMQMLVKLLKKTHRHVTQSGNTPDVIISVHQEPSSILGVVRDSETISCSHSVSSYNVILWYQQSAGDTALKLIGYIYYANPTLEEPFQQHFNVTGDGSTKSQLRVLKLRQPQDSGVCLGLDVRQSPSDVFARTGDREQMFCSHDKTDYRVMLWYQRSPGDTAMKLIGFLHYQAATLEKPYEEHFNISGDLGGAAAKKSSLSVQITGPEHNAVYYCAANYAQLLYFLSPLYKNYQIFISIYSFDRDLSLHPAAVFLLRFHLCQLVYTYFFFIHHFLFLLTDELSGGTSCISITNNHYRMRDPSDLHLQKSVTC
ncbi:hypothetical protein F2P81_003058 [Scophthalmus maximus]|uniref:Ig-like domain-containing protein n=1 Tax=Scophthalmus maximus TaxID=52904 RepID=A0A6A4TJR6_SCOMX|nr:hypothetical protein F2P81_003058 [Scophthalmus maximus]